MPVTESEKVYSRILPFIEGRTVLDLGCGVKKIAPWAVGVDDWSESIKNDPGVIACRVDPESRALDGRVSNAFDVVFSSHTLEHMKSPIPDTLRYWASFARTDGLLILYLPDENRYRFDPRNPSVKNPQHAHLLTPSNFAPMLDQVKELQLQSLQSDPMIHDHYSFLVICKVVRR